MSEITPPIVNLYNLISLLFRAGGGIFYASFDIRGEDEIAKEGTPTLFLFNHCNSLSDPVVIISRTPRQVCFTTKDTAFKHFFFGPMIRYSGAIPVYRKKEHGGKASSFNAGFYKAVYAGLFAGKCIAVAPEGACKFSSHMFKFKTGAGFIAIEAILKKKFEDDDEAFFIAFQPAVMQFTHREKFRSDVLLKFIKPVKVDFALLRELNPAIANVKPNEFSEVKKDVAAKLTRKLEKLFHRHVVSSPDWSSINLAITATRIHLPYGTNLSLNAYFNLLIGWLDVLKSRKVERPSDPSEYNEYLRDFSSGEVDNINSLYLQLKLYQKLIDAVKVKDERFRRIEQTGAKRSFVKTLAKVVYRLLILTIIVPIALPGLALWSPSWVLIRQREKQLIARGRTWADSIAENKMLIGLWSVLAISVGSYYFGTTQPRILMPVATCGYLWLTMRLYEEAVSCTRSIFGIMRLYLLGKERLETILRERRKCREQIGKCFEYFPQDKAEEILAENGRDVKSIDMRKELGQVNRPSFWVNFNIFRRHKKDWNEMLRLDDFATMDYVQ